MAAKRKIYPAECKRDAVALIPNHGYGGSEAARNVGRHATMLRQWTRAVEHHGTQAVPGNGRLRPAQEALHRLRQDNTRRRMEREIWKQAALFFANEAHGGTRLLRRRTRAGRCRCCVR